MIQNIIDAHVHGFPNPLFDAIWKYFEKNYWSILYPEEIEDSYTGNWSQE